MPLQYCSPFCAPNFIQATLPAIVYHAAFDEFTGSGNSCTAKGFSSAHGRWQRSLRGGAKPQALESTLYPRLSATQKTKQMTCFSGFK